MSGGWNTWINPLAWSRAAWAWGSRTRWTWMLPKIEAWEPTLLPEADSDLRKRSLSLKYRAKCGEPLERMLIEGYALVREAARRKLGMRHYPVQLLAGIALHHRSIAEMQTGEGKTLTATLPLYLNALTGRGALLATANDYLAHRDADDLRPVYEMLGLTIGCVQANLPPPAREPEYACDITYGTAKEFGFDFLRDQLLLRRMREGQADVVGRMVGGASAEGDRPVQRAPFFVLVDEADSLLIDEARTPLIISALPGAAQERLVASFNWAAEVAPQFIEDEHYTYDHKKHELNLTMEGRKLARTLPRPAVMDVVPTQSIYEYVERAIRAKRDFLLDQAYVVRDGEIVIVDEFTGRLGEGRKWRDGLHQAIEAKEKVKLTVDAGQAARVTIQDFFSRFEKLSGMTGTAANSAVEFARVFRLQVVVIPTHRPNRRARLPDRVFGTAEKKWQAIVDEIRELHALGRPVLVGTRSIEQSEHLSKLLQAPGVEIKHEVLNARHLEAEAKIVAEAGKTGSVTVSTNMAGRGTDIKLGPGVAELGGLHVIVTELHDSARIDRQLIGRSARQGDPGAYRFYLCLEDEILKNAYGPKAAERYAEIGKRLQGSAEQYHGLFYRAQRKLEAKHFRDRKILLYHEQERKKMQIQMGQDPYLDTPF